MLKKIFGFDSNKNQVKTELFAGVTTFLTMAYILAINPAILSDAGMDKGAVFTSTILAAVFATFVMAIHAKLPFALAPAMGLNAFFAYTVCLQMGYSWQFALTAVFIEGLIFILLTLSNVRELIVDCIPMSMKYAISVGIGLFIAFLGLQHGGVVVAHPTTYIALGDVTQGSALLTCIGILITGLMLVFKIKGALLWSILLTALIGLPLGITEVGGLMSMPPSISPIFMKFDFTQIFTGDMVIAVITLLFVDLFDTIGTLVGVSTKAGMMKDGKIPRIKKAFMADALGTTFGAMLGTSTVSTYMESASGISEGGRTGMTAFFTALCFLASLFFAPLFLSIPPAATAPVLVLVGLMMLTPIKKINLADYSEAIPAFVCMICMPFAYSISDGVLLGMICYVLINILARKFDKLNWSVCILSFLFIIKYLMGYISEWLH